VLRVRAGVGLGLLLWVGGGLLLDLGAGHAVGC
jgi:hypothetical protein